MAAPTTNSRNPANSGSVSGAFKEILGKFLSTVDDMLPAEVIAYDRAENRVTVRPLIRILKTDDTLEDRAEIASVPVLSLGGGGVVLAFNILPGDIGWIKANDRDISLFTQNVEAGAVGPNTLRKHSFSDAVFIPDQFRKWTIADPGIDGSAMLLQTLDGLQRIAIDSEGVRIFSDTEIRLDAPTVVIIGTIFHVGTLTTFGEHSIIGNVTLTGTLMVAGINFNVHVHGGVTAGNVNTDGPQ